MESQGKGFLESAIALPVVGILTFTILNSSFVFAQRQSQEDILLEKRVLELADEHKISTQALAPRFSLSEGVAKLRAFNAKAEAKVTKCVDKDKKVFASKYVLTFDAQNKPCRIYDLSFPNAQALFTRKKVTQIPVRSLTSKDYLNWLDGNVEEIQKANELYKLKFNPKLVAKYSWVAKLKFKNKVEVVPGSKMGFYDNGLPQSFSLADLDLGSQFKFDSKALAELNELRAELVSKETMGSIYNEEILASEHLLKLMNKPETFLQGIRFNWNELDKVYDIILEADFLPIMGPVALVDYQRQYKYAVEKMFRSLIASSLGQLARFIPHKLAAAAIEVLINDAFEQLEMAYDYQMLQLEDALKLIAADSRSPLAEEISPEYALNLLFGQRSDLFSSYIMAVAQNKEFDWQAFDKLGKAARYNTEKQREVIMGKMNSRLVLEKKCNVEFLHTYFGICSKAGEKSAVYSLISEQSLAIKSFGAPLIHRYSRPYETTFVRGGTWILSLALRIFGLPLSRTVTYQLDSILKKYMQSGLLDEALLKNRLTLMKTAAPISNENNVLLNWLFVQNLNPFLAKSLSSENNLIAINKQLLGITEL